MYDHTNCKHDKTKVARAACRREHESGHTSAQTTTGKTQAGARRQPRLPSVIAPKLRPIIDRAQQLGLTVRLSHDAPDGVEQLFVISSKAKPDCRLVLEAFASARKGVEGKAEFYHVENDHSRQLSRQRALADLEELSKR